VPTSLTTNDQPALSTTPYQRQCLASVTQPVPLPRPYPKPGMNQNKTTT